MRNTEFAVTFPVSIDVFGQPWSLTCTASPRGWDLTPAVLWLENHDHERYFVPEQVWDDVEAELAHGGPARDAYEAALAGAGVPFMAEAAE
jgi:hypothetical protein